MPSQYEDDFYGWCIEQADILFAGTTHMLDFKNVAEEIRSLGKREKRELTSLMNILFMHLLKCEFQSNYKTNSWKYTILEHQARIKELISENTSLKPTVQECADKAYEYARINASQETMLPLETFPENREFTVEWALNWEE